MRLSHLFLSRLPKQVREQMRETVLRVMQSRDPGVLRVAIDCGWDSPSIMSDKEVKDLADQLTAAYGINLRSSKPCHLYLTGLKKNGRIDEAFNKYCSGFEQYMVDKNEKLHHELFQPTDLVYLSPDSRKVLHSLDPSKVYVIGGIVDRSARKGLTEYDASTQGLQTMRLPIKEYMCNQPGSRAPGHCNLPINQVLGILLSVHEDGDWRNAFQKYIAKRKGFVLKQS